MKTKLKIFLSYTRADTERVEALYERLSNAGFEPWMDKKNIIGGEQWKRSIQTAIRKSDFFLVCLSRHSFGKRGFLQREIRIALDVREELLDSDIYLIPVRLEECDVPDNLADINWIDLFEADGWPKLTKSFHEGVIRRGKLPDDSVTESSNDSSAEVLGDTMQDRIDLQPDTFVRIAASGDVPLTKVEKEIVGTADFHRLFRMKQVGSAYLIYPTAVHTKFDHSLGTLNMAAQIIRAIRENPGNSADESHIPPHDEQLIRLSALLHSITALPFGHTLEAAGIIQSQNTDHVRSERFLGTLSEIGRIVINGIGLNSHQRLLKIFNAGSQGKDLGKHSYIHDIVHGSLSADLLDTLHRDSYFSNLGLNVDIRRIQQHLFINNDGQRRTLALRLWNEGKNSLRRDILAEFMHLVETRYLLAERMWFHRTKRAADAMLTASVLREILTGSLEQKELWEMGDESLIDRLCASKSETVRILATSILKRLLWKEVATFKYNSFDATHLGTASNRLRSVAKILTKDVTARKKAEDALSLHYKVGNGDLLLYCSPITMNLKLLSTRVLLNKKVAGIREHLNDLTTIRKVEMLEEMYRNLWSLSVFVNPIHRNCSFENIGEVIQSFFDDIS